jgi:ribosomal-protein-alanine N-acetyltransferase
MMPESEGPEMTIRPATPADLQSLVCLEQACFAIPWSEQSLAADLGNPSLAHYFVAELENGEIAGSIACYTAADTAQITNLAVRPQNRRQGIGRRLLAALLDWARQNGIRTVDLEVRVSNEPAIRLYEEAGFVTVGRRPHYYADNAEDANIMLKKFF